MKKINVIRTRQLDLCLSCELCSAVCPVGAIKMEYKFGQFLPIVDEKKCMNCGLCLEVCPGIDIDPFQLRHKKVSESIIFDGPCLESYTGYVNDSFIRRNSTSGGLVTALIIELIKNQEFEAAFVLPFDKFTGQPARLKAVNEINKILNSAKSKYIPASLYEVIISLKKKDNTKYIIAGTPCQIYGVKKFLRKNEISEKNILFLGLFCDKTLNFNIIKYFEETYSKPNERLTKIEFRTKENSGWPGDAKLCFDSGRELIVDKKVRMQLKDFFQLKRCLFCINKLNQMADISFGDCYINGKEDPCGKSSAIIRTEKGKKIFDKYAYLFTLEKEDVEEIRRSQHLIEKKNNLEYVKILIKKHNLSIGADFKISPQAIRQLSKLQKYIGWGENCCFAKIKFSLILSKKINQIKKLVRWAISGLIIAIVILKDFLKKKSIFNETKENIVLIGGFSNKGAQAMTFTAVDQIKRIFKNKKIYLFSSEGLYLERGTENIYNFEILPWRIKTKIKILNPIWFLFKRGDSANIENNIREIIENTIFFIDISGYALSSQWGFLTSVNYLLNIMIAKKYSIPYYIFPQSIGPFNYPLIHKFLLYPLMKLYLKYPKKIFVREEEGIVSLRQFTQKNVQKSSAMILRCGEYNLANIFNSKFPLKKIIIDHNSVGVIPNSKVIARSKSGEIYSIYESLINRLIGAGKTVYILSYSPVDLWASGRIKNFFPNNTKVKLIANNFNAIELENIIKQFDFIVASRYHSIIHAYKNGVPALVIGWATKYYELLKDFNQIEYFFDIRTGIDAKEINVKLDQMMQNYKASKEKIIKKIAYIVEKENPFKYLADPNR